MRLGNLLREYDIRSGNIRFPDGRQTKGYQRADFADAWRRYCPPDPVAGNQLASVSDETDPGLFDSLDGSGGEASQPSQPSHPRSAWDGFAPWDGSSRPSTPSRPSLTSTGTPGTAGTAPPTCISCRLPMSHDDGTHAHPTCQPETA